MAKTTRNKSATLSTKEHKKVPIWAKILIGIITLIGTVLITVFVSATIATNAPKKISDQFVNNLQDGDISAAYTLTSSKFKESTPESELQNLSSSNRNLISGTEKITKKSIFKRSGSPSYAVVHYSVNGSNEKVGYLKVQLQKEGNDWKVMNLRISPNPIESDVE